MGNLPEAVRRFEAAKAILEKHPTSDGRTAAIGYCFGGGIVLHMARTGMDLAGVASFHGMLGTKTPAKKGVVRAKVLVLHGGASLTAWRTATVSTSSSVPAM
jgi:dienelactone hydrolase